MTAVPIDWTEFETILLDMDGTVLDLAFDNYFWRVVVPRHAASRAGQALAATCERLHAAYARKAGSLDWYCLDYWSATLGFDLRPLKAAASHRIRYLPGARGALRCLANRPPRVVLVTNAHRDTLALKDGVAGLASYFDDVVTSHDFGVPKEHADFWPALQARLDFDPRRALFVDDSEPVRRAASDFGIDTVVAVTVPDSSLPPADAGAPMAVERISALFAV